MPLVEESDSVALKKSLGTMASHFAPTIGKLYLAPPGESNWRDSRLWGLLCVVLDRTPPRTVHIRLYTLPLTDSPTILFNQEIYENMLYNCPSAMFHVFEANNCMVGLSFCDQAEALDFASTVKRMTPVSSNVSSPASVNSTKKSSGISQFVSRIFGKSVAVEIGTPTDVRHTKHIGYNAETGFDLADIPEEWTSIFKNAGIKKRDLKNPESAKVIFETLQTTLGVTEHGDSAKSPSSTSSSNQQTSPLKPQVPSSPRPKKQSNGIFSSAAAPPAPPLDVPAPPPIAETLGNSQASSTTSPSTTATVRSPKLSISSSDATAELHASIRAGIKLKKVQTPSKDDALPEIGALSAEEANSLAVVLQRAMKARCHTFQTEETEETEDNDWD